MSTQIFEVAPGAQVTVGDVTIITVDGVGVDATDLTQGEDRAEILKWWERTCAHEDRVRAIWRAMLVFMPALKPAPAPDCQRCGGSGTVNAWASSGEYETEDCPACAVPAVYTVHPVTLDCGRECFEVRNGRTGHVAMSTPHRENADLEARHRNLYEAQGDTDADWVSGSSRNWWARNAGEAF